MKCPYAVNRTRIIQTQIEYDDENIEQGSTTVENNTATFLECLLNECGAYNRETGKCEYKA